MPTISDAVRQALIDDCNLEIQNIRVRLIPYLLEMQQVQYDFQVDRKALLSQARRHTRRPVVTYLLLAVGVRSDSRLRVPIASWRYITAKGGAAESTLAQVAARRRSTRVRPGGKGRMAILSDTIAKNRKDGWRIADLLRHAHPIEADLIKKTEPKLRAIRREVAALCKRGTLLLQRAAAHQRYLDNADPFWAPERRAPTKSKAVKVKPVRFRSLQTNSDASPQFKVPRDSTNADSRRRTYLAPGPVPGDDDDAPPQFKNPR